MIVTVVAGHSHCIPLFNRHLKFEDDSIVGAGRAGAYDVCMKDVTAVTIDLAGKEHFVVAFYGIVAEVAAGGRGEDAGKGVTVAQFGREFEQDVGAGASAGVLPVMSYSLT